MLIAVDPNSKATGFSFGGPGDGAPRGGVWTLPGADEHVFDRTLRLAGDSLTELARMVKAKHVVIEAPLLLIDRYHSTDAAAALIQMTGALRGAADRAGCRVTLIAVSTVRKAFIGNGRLPGAEAKAAVQRQCRLLGWSYADDNVADAHAIWMWAMSNFHPTWSPSVVRAAG